MKCRVPPTTPYESCGQIEDCDPQKKNRAATDEQHQKGGETHYGIPESCECCAAKLCSEGFRWRSDLLPQSKEDIREDDAVFCREAVRFQAIDVCIYAGDLPLQFHDVAIGIRLLLKQFLQVMQRALRIGQAGFQVGPLLGDLIGSFLLPLDLAKSFQLA